jgi:hypothetical protein
MILDAAASASHSAATAVVTEAVWWMADLEAMKTTTRAHFTSSFLLVSEPVYMGKAKKKTTEPVVNIKKLYLIFQTLSPYTWAKPDHEAGKAPLASSGLLNRQQLGSIKQERTKKKGGAGYEIHQCFFGINKTILLLQPSSVHLRVEARPTGPVERLGDWDGRPDVIASLCSPGVPQGQAESGGILLAAVSGTRVPRGGVTRQGVALTDRKSLVGCQYGKLPFSCSCTDVAQSRSQSTLFLAFRVYGLRFRVNPKPR